MQLRKEKFFVPCKSGHYAYLLTIISSTGPYRATGKTSSEMTMGKMSGNKISEVMKPQVGRNLIRHFANQANVLVKKTSGKTQFNPLKKDTLTGATVHLLLAPIPVLIDPQQRHAPAWV